MFVICLLRVEVAKILVQVVVICALRCVLVGVLLHLILSLKSQVNFSLKL